MLQNKGVTLVEVMIALVVLLIVFMGLIQASLVSIDQNVRNEVRDEAVRIAAEYMTRTKATAFSAVTATGINCAAGPATWTAFPGTPTVARDFRNMPITYNIGRCVDDLDTENKRVGVVVTWPYKGENFTHTILSTLRSK
ncbi:MAG: prepilin-type N-terminal cleavage/methylation domain-containing protein [Nitrospirae bacterium]|nr:prepilin-type N-terminal cleavage/methylation domain-containing protein [Nitrospirota bacterium]